MVDGWFGLDGGCYNTIWERNAADNRYKQNQKQIEELDKANKLAEKKLQEERENAEIIAEATRKAENDRYQKEKNIEMMRQENDKEARFNMLCDRFGISYEDMCDFNMLLNYDSNEAKKIYQDFISFRKEHYVRDIEILFRKLNLNLGTISKDEIKSTGTFEDYIDYIYGVIMDNSNIINEIKEKYEYSDPLLYQVIDYVVENQEEIELEIQEKIELEIQEEFNITLKRVKNIFQQMEERAIFIKQNNNTIKVMWSKERWKEIKSDI